MAHRGGQRMHAGQLERIAVAEGPHVFLRCAFAFFRLQVRSTAWRAVHDALLRLGHRRA